MLTLEEKLNLLRTSSFLGAAPSGLLSQLVAAAVQQSFEKGQFIYAKNDPARDFYILVEGRIGHPEVQAGEEGSLARRVDAPGQLFGFAAAVEGQPARVISAQCELPTTVLAVDGCWFQELCRRYGPEGEERLRELVRAYAGYERTILGRPGWVSVRNAKKKFGSGESASIALDDCSIEVRPGEFCVIAGLPGCGKSTLARAIAGAEPLDDGIIYLDEEVINRAGNKRAPNRVYLHRRGALLPKKTLLENLERNLKTGKALDNRPFVRKAHELLTRFELADYANRRPREFSDSVRRRAEIVCSYFHDVPVVAFDEPFSDISATQVHRLLLNLHQFAPKTVLFMSESIEESVYLADRVQVMVSGRIKESFLVDLPRPRVPELKAASEFLRLTRKGGDALRALSKITLESHEMPAEAGVPPREERVTAAEFALPNRERTLPAENAIREALHVDRFFWTIEFIPSVDKILRDQLHKLGGIADVLADDSLLGGFAVTDRVVSERDPDPIAAASHLADYSGKQPLVHFSGKGRELDDLHGFVARMQENGLENALFITGDRLKREPPHARPRYLESVPAIAAARKANPRLLIAAALNPFKYREEDAMAQYLKLGKKVGAGADFVITQIGFDMRKYEEALYWVGTRDYRIPMLANVMPMPPARARYIRHHQLAGVTVTDSFLGLLEQEEQLLADKGASRVMRRLALQILGLKLYGYAGVQITGLHSIEKLSALKTQLAELSGLCGERITWNKAWAESLTLPEGGHADPAPRDPWYLAHTRPRRASVRQRLKYAVMDGVHAFLFDKGFGARVMGPLLKPVKRHGELDRCLKGIERAIKGPLLGCETCGMCRLAATQYVCPETCPKGLANGACGGTTENLCEFRDRECIHSTKYRIAKDAGVLDQLEAQLIPAVPKNFRHSCSWPPHFRGEGPRIELINFQRPEKTRNW